MRGEPSIRLRVGEANPRLDAFLARVGLETAACVAAQEGLDEVLQEQGYAGTGEGSVLVVGLPRDGAREVGRRLRQRAVIFHQRGRETELVFVG